MESGKQVGVLIMTAVALIVGVILLAASAQQVGNVTNTITVANASLGTLTNGTTLHITAYKSCTGFKVFNATGDEEVASSNYTVTNNVVYNGQESISVSPQVTAGYVSAWNKGTATYDGVCQPLTYEPSSGGRAIAGIIIVMFAIALAVVALYPTMREAGVLGVR